MIDSSPEYPRLCLNCPLVPAGVTAELTSLETLSEREMREYKYGGERFVDGQLADEQLSETLSATFTVIESRNPSNDVGDSAVTDIRTYGQGHPQVRLGFERCEGPARRGLIARVLGNTATCSGLPANY